MNDKLDLNSAFATSYATPQGRRNLWSNFDKRAVAMVTAKDGSIATCVIEPDRTTYAPLAFARDASADRLSAAASRELRALQPGRAAKRATRSTGRNRQPRWCRRRTAPAGSLPHDAVGLPANSADPSQFDPLKANVT